MALLPFEIFALKFLSKDLCIRSTSHRVGRSCHLFEYHVLLIQKSKFRRDDPASFRNIRAEIFIERPLYQEHLPYRCLVVPPPRVSCTSDTIIGNISEASRFISLNFRFLYQEYMIREEVARGSNTVGGAPDTEVFRYKFEWEYFES